MPQVVPAVTAATTSPVAAWALRCGGGVSGDDVAKVDGQGMLKGLITIKDIEHAG